MATEKTLIELARSWLGTRYAHQGRRKQCLGESGGVDCLGLLIGVAAEAGLVARDGSPLIAHDRRRYSRQPDGNALCAVLAELLWPVWKDDPYAIGQVGVFRFEGNPQHLGLIGDRFCDGFAKPTLIHAYAPSRKVVEHLLDEEWQSRCVMRFRLCERQP